MGQHISPHGGMIIEWTLVSIGFTFVCTRLYVNGWLRRSLNLGDYLVAQAFVLWLFFTCCDTVSFLWGFWYTDAWTGEAKAVDSDYRILVMFKLNYICSAIYYTISWSIKGAFLVFYYQLIPKTKISWLKVALHIVTAIVVSSWIIMVCLNYFWCMPVSRNWSLDEKEICYSYIENVPYFTTLGLHIFTDVLIYILPFPLLRVLQLTTRKKIGVALIFAMGAVCIAICVGRVVSLGSTFDPALWACWSGAEQLAAFIVVCLPPLKWLYKANKYNNRARGASLARPEGAAILKTKNTLTHGVSEIEPESATETSEGRDVETGQVRQQSGLLQAFEHTHDSVESKEQSRKSGANDVEGRSTTPTMSWYSDTESVEPELGNEGGLKPRHQSMHLMEERGWPLPNAWRSS